MDEPLAGPGQVVVDVERAGVCGTDEEFYSGQMTYLHSGEAAYPVRIGHEWCGVVSALGDGVDAGWLGRRVTADTMLGCGRCQRCRSGRQHLCAERHEIGIRRGWPGALAEKLPVPSSALLALPDAVDSTLGALVEPAGNALRAVRGAAAQAGQPLLVMGPGTIGLLVAQIAAARGAEVHLLGRSEGSLGFARSLGFEQVWTNETLPRLPFMAVVDASNAEELPALAIELVEPGGRVVYIGLAGEPSLVDSRQVVLKDLTVVGVLSASGALEEAIGLLAEGAIDASPLVAATVTLDELAPVLAGERRPEWGNAPKIHVDPRTCATVRLQPASGGRDMSSTDRRSARLIGGLLMALLLSTTAGAGAVRATQHETYLLSGYEIFFAPTMAVFAGTGGAGEGSLSAWYGSIQHSGVISPTGTIEGGWAVLYRHDGVRIGGWFSGGDVVLTDEGPGCTTEAHSVEGTLIGVTRSDTGAVGTGVFRATLLHHRAWLFGTCISYSASVNGSIELTF
ncbi:MAG TPA: alcohol dehydrogenase catalytic domain-containing protein [Candidatus Limnocylindria bacterium]|nr:alcohol dehydrogenase catalytic domain-containing protein [Candidatus Limnocylindria bacterium]